MEKEVRDQLLIEAMDTYGHYLKRVVFALVKDEQKAEDIVQEVFIQYYINLEKFEFRSSVKTYLYRIAINLCRNYFKSWSSRKLEFSNFVQQSFIYRQSPEMDLITKESNSAIGDMIQKLPSKYREVIWLYYYAQFSVAEISEVLNCSQNTVKTRLARGRKLAKLNFEEVSDDGTKC